MERKLGCGGTAAWTSTRFQSYGDMKNLAEIQSIVGIEWEFTGLIISHGSHQHLSDNLIGPKKSPTPFRRYDWQPRKTIISTTESWKNCDWLARFTTSFEPGYFL
jgi:hypothetical protein